MTGRLFGRHRPVLSLLVAIVVAGLFAWGHPFWIDTLVMIAIFAMFALSAGISYGQDARQEILAFIHELFPILRDRHSVAAGMLSGGEQQMLAIGLALGRRPRALLLDEPTQGLAPAVFDILENAMQRLRRSGIAILLAEQNLSFATRVADRYLVLAHGHVVATGDAASMKDEERMSALYFGRTQ